jgi:hypothetical protein
MALTRVGPCGVTPATYTHAHKPTHAAGQLPHLHPTPPCPTTPCSTAIAHTWARPTTPT